MKKYIKYSLLTAIFILSATSCQDFLDKTPSNALPTEEALSDITGLKSALYGVYDRLQEFEDYYGAQMVFYGSVRGDLMQARAIGFRGSNLYEMSYTAEARTPQIWDVPYKAIRQANNIIEAIDGGNIINTDEVLVNDIKGQALAIRALCHFDLLRVYGEIFTNPTTGMGIPIITTSIDTDTKSSRNTVPETYAQIIKDLNDAIAILKSSRSLGFFNSWAAKALLSRVYLYQKDYVNALTTAVNVIDSSGYTLWSNAEYVDAWSKQGTSEVLFEIINSNSNDWVGLEFVGNLYDEDGYADIINTPKLIAMFSANDVRSDVSIVSSGTIIKPNTPTTTTPGSTDKIFCNKFPGRNGDPKINNVPVLRISEIYLIAAEAAFYSGNQTKAIDYTNKILKRANPNATDLTTVTIDNILNQRALELYGEGHRFFDLLRNDKEIDRIDRWEYTLKPESTIFNKTYFRTILPIRRAEINANPVIAKQQNPGY